MIHKKRGPFARFPFKAIGTWWRGARFPNVTEWARSITNTHIYMSIQPAHRPSCRPTYFPFGAPFVMDLLTFFRILQFLEEGKVWDFFFFFKVKNSWNRIRRSKYTVHSLCSGAFFCLTNLRDTSVAPEASPNRIPPVRIAFQAARNQQENLCCYSSLN